MSDVEDQINCHYVTRSLTSEWEKDGWLYYFDFKNKLIKKDFSKKLFATEGANSREIEQIFSKYVETPLGRFKRKVSSSQITEVRDWRIYRALFLYFVFQAKRIKTRIFSGIPDIKEEAEEFFKRDEKFLDSLVMAFVETENIVGFNMPSGNVLYFPETGFFQFPIDDMKALTGFSIATAVPLTPFFALAMVSKTADLKKFREFHGTLDPFSVGLNENNSRVLIPHFLLEYNDEEKITEVLLNHREGAKKQVELHFKKEDIIRQMLELGFNPN